MYPESMTLITEIEATGVQLKPETYIDSEFAGVMANLPCCESFCDSEKTNLCVFY